MKIENKIIITTVLLALLFWVVDAALDYFLYYEGSFLELLIINPPAHEIYMRALGSAFILIFGAVMAGVTIRRKQAEELWQDYTLDLLSKLFTTDRIRLEFDQSVSSWGLSLNFQEKAQEFFRHLDRRLNTLRSIFRRLELFEEKSESHPENIMSVHVQEEITKQEDIQVSEYSKTWKAIEEEYGISKRSFGKKIDFVKGSFKRSIIFRDVEHSFALANSGYSKSAVILAGSVIEELLKLFLEHNSIKLRSTKFDDYITACKESGLLKSGIINLSDSVRHFRNLVHLSVEKTKKHTISKAAAKGAVASIFTIANDF